MQSLPSIGRALYRITLHRGSPQRIQHSAPLTGMALLATLVLAVASQLLVFRSDGIDLVLYLTTLFCGGYLGVAWLSRRVPPARLRSVVQAVALVAAVGHLLLLPAAMLPFWAAAAAGAVAAGLAVLALGNCLQFALGPPRSRALIRALAFAFVLVAFYATMHTLLAIALP